MRIKWITAICLFLCAIGIPISGMSQQLDPDLFQPSSLVSRETAEKQLSKIYHTSGKFRTLHCGCVFDKLKQVFPNICEQGPKPVSQDVKPINLEWVNMMPAHVFGKFLKCWNKPLCSRRGGNKVSGQQCCSEVSPKFKKLESDMHNIFPAVEKPSSMKENFDFGGRWEYEFCPLEGNALSANIKGDAARAHFYMSYLYKLPLQEKLEDSLRKWHFEDPPDEWELKRNDMIEVIQGNRNPFIDQPELVERVADF